MTESAPIAGRMFSPSRLDRWTDGQWGYAVTLLPGALAIAGNLLGRYWTIGTIVYSTVLALADWWSRIDRRRPRSDSATIPDALLALHVALHTAAVVTLLTGIAGGSLRHAYLWIAVISTGISSGQNGINTAHELIHRRSRLWRWAGLWNLLLVNYGHWMVSHLRIHHRLVGTIQDPVTARRGETLYHFVPRVMVQQLLTTWRLEAQRCVRRGRWPIGPSHFGVRCLAAQAMMGVGIVSVFGPLALAAWLLQSLVAVVDLELVNYMQHYGLEREIGSSLTPAHSWECNRLSSRWSLIELTRHSDHHLHATKPYHSLRATEESPELPAGYFGLMAVAAIPRWWFSMIHPILDTYLASQQNETAATLRLPDRTPISRAA